MHFAQKKILIIANPKAGSMDLDKFKEGIEEAFSGTDRVYELHFTSPKENIREMVKEAIKEGLEMVVAAGGDGTVTLVADGLEGTNVPLGILPMGTGNMLAKGLGITDNFDDALALITGSYDIRPVNGMKMGDHLYLLYVGAGFSSKVMEDTSQDSKRQFHFFAYLWSGIKHLLGWQPISFRVEIDGREIRTGAIEVGVTNIQVTGQKYFNWEENISNEDNFFLICFVRGKSLLDYIQMAYNLLTGSLNRSKQFHCFKAYKHIGIDAIYPIPVEADGDQVTETPVEFEIIPAAISIVVPKLEDCAAGA